MSDRNLKKAVDEAREVQLRLQTLRGDIQGKRDALAGERAKLCARNEFVRALPVNRADLKNFICETVDILGRGFLQRTSYRRFIERFAYPQAGHDSFMNSMSSRPLSLADIEKARGEGGWNSLALGARHFFCGMLDTETSIRADALCFFFGDTIKAKLAEHLDELVPDYADDRRHGGAPRAKFHEHYKSATPAELASTTAERFAEIKRNDEKIEALDRQIEELDEHLAELSGADGPLSAAA